MEPPIFLPREAFTAARGERDVPFTAQGLWSVGTLEGLRRATVAIVGTRAATAYGRRIARSFARDLARAGCTVISGLALGIDAAAHEGALDAGAPTIGVLGGGHDRFFPKRNLGLAERMLASGGAVLSPFEATHPPYPSQFLARNAIVAALADAVLVIEAPARSGALNTAGWAAGRIPVLAVPGDIDRPHVRGCHALIRDGAILAQDPRDVLEALRIAPLPTTEATHGDPTPVRSDPLEQAMLTLLRDGETSLDAIAASLREDVPHLLVALTMLELDGVVERRDGERFALRGHPYATAQRRR